jgi:hypothetical protein
MSVGTNPTQYVWWDTGVPRLNFMTRTFLHKKYKESYIVAVSIHLNNVNMRIKCRRYMHTTTFHENKD